MIIYKEAKQQEVLTTVSVVPSLTRQNIEYLRSLGFKIKKNNERNHQWVLKRTRTNTR